VLQEGAAVFTPKARDQMWFRTPFPLKGSIHATPTGPEVVARAPAGPTVFVLAWAVAMAITGGIGTVIVAGLVLLLTLRYERGRALRLVDDLAHAADPV
jgi:hypothetical protein